MSAQVFITGLGMVTSLGADVETSWKKALAGESGIAPIASFDAKALPIAGAGEVSEETLLAIRERLPEEYAGEGERRVLFALDAAQSAVADAGMRPGDYAPERAGVVMGTGLSSYRLEDFSAWADPENGFDAARFATELDKTQVRATSTTRPSGRRRRLRSGSNSGAPPAPSPPPARRRDRR